MFLMTPYLNFDQKSEGKFCRGRPATLRETTANTATVTAN